MGGPRSCIDFAKDFIVSGTASDQLFGTCESLWEPDLGPEDLFETCSQALLNAVDRDALSGWGAHVYIITKDKITKRLLKGKSAVNCSRWDSDGWWFCRKTRLGARIDTTKVRIDTTKPPAIVTTSLLCFRTVITIMTMILRSMDGWMKGTLCIVLIDN